MLIKNLEEIDLVIVNKTESNKKYLYQLILYNKHIKVMNSS